MWWILWFWHECDLLSCQELLLHCQKCCADPYEIPTSFKTSLMVICWLAYISPFEILLVFTVQGLPLQGSFSRNSCPLLKLLYQTHTAIFLKSKIPINSLQVLHCLCSTLPYPAHELFAKTETFAMTAGTHLHLSISCTWQTSSNVQLLPTHAYKGNRQHILHQRCHITTHLNTSLHFWEHLIPLHTDRTCKWTVGAEVCSGLNREKPRDHSNNV